MSLADCGYFLIAQAIHSATGRIGVDSKRATDAYGCADSEEHALPLRDRGFLSEQPFRKNIQPENAGYSGCDFLWSEIAAQKFTDLLEHLLHQKRSLPGINTFNSCHGFTLQSRLLNYVHPE